MRSVDQDGFVLDDWRTFYEDASNGSKPVQGARGLVKKVRRKNADGDNTTYALKLMKLANTDIRQGFEREARIYQIVDHPNIVHMHEAYRYRDGPRQFVALSMDLCKGGDLNDAIVTHTNPSLSGKGGSKWSLHKRLVATRSIARQLLRAVAYLHEDGRNICHRDLKCENVLLVDNLADASPEYCNERDCELAVKIADFGEAKVLTDADEKMTERVGSEEYMSPQVLQPDVPYTKACDLWSIGVICLTSLLGEIPWDFYTRRRMKQVITNLAHPDAVVQQIALAQFLDVLAGHFNTLRTEVSRGDESNLQQAEELIRALLCPSEAERIGAAEALTCKWFQRPRRNLKNYASLVQFVGKLHFASRPSVSTMRDILRL